MSKLDDQDLSKIAAGTDNVTEAPSDGATERAGVKPPVGGGTIPIESGGGGGTPIEDGGGPTTPGQG